MSRFSQRIEGHDAAEERSVDTRGHEPERTSETPQALPRREGAGVLGDLPERSPNAQDPSSGSAASKPPETRSDVSSAPPELADLQGAASETTLNDILDFLVRISPMDAQRLSGASELIGRDTSNRLLTGRAENTYLPGDRDAALLTAPRARTQASISADGRALDLSMLAPVACRERPRELAEASLEGVTSLRLPAGLGTLPDWVSSLKNLTHLDARGFRGETLRADNRWLRKIFVDGRVVRDIETRSLGATVYCRRKWDIAGHKVNVRYLHPCTGETIAESAAIGQRYQTSGRHGQIDYRNLNGKARFPGTGGQPIVCRHLAVHQVHRLMAHRARRGAERFADEWAREMASEQKISSAVDEETQARFAELIVGPAQHHHVGSTQWGRFMRDQFASMISGEARHFVIADPGHAMTLELVRLRTARGERYAATFCDPDETLTGRRLVETDLDYISQWQESTFRAKPKINLFEGAKIAHRSGSRESRVMRFIEVPKDFYTRPMAAPMFTKASGFRPVREYLSEHESIDPARFYFLLGSGHLEASKLRHAVARCATVAGKFELLLADSGNGLTGLLVAMEADHASSIDALGEVMIEGRSGSWLTNEQFAQVLTQPCGGDSPLVHAAKRGCAGAIRAWGGILQQGWRAAWVPSQRVKAMLASVGAAGRPALHLALQNNQADAVGALMDLCANACQDGLLTNDEFADILAAKRPEAGVSGVGCAMARGNALAIETFGDRLGRARVLGLLTSSQIVALLSGTDDNGMPGLLSALGWGHRDSVVAWGKILADPRIANGLSAGDLMQLLLAKDSDGTPALHHALREGRADAVRVFGQLLSIVPIDQLSEDDVAQLLASKDAQGRTGLQAAAEAGHGEAQAAFRDVVAAVQQRGQLSTSRARTLLRDLE